jgi:ribosome-associated protein
MARKPRNLEADEVDETNGLDADETPSRSARKRASHELTKLGEELVALRPSRFATLALPELLQEAVVEARRLKSFGAQRRQAQFIGKLMRKLDEEALAALRKALERP